MSVEITMVDVHKSVRIPLEDISAHVNLVTSLNQTTETVKVSETLRYQNLTHVESV